MTDKPLNEQQRLFGKLYASLSNATEAAKQAGYSPKTAYSTGARLAKDDRILALIEQIKSRQHVVEVLDEERISQELGHIATANFRTMFDKDGAFKDPKDWDEGLVRSVASVKIVDVKGGKARVADVRFWDKLTALKLAGVQVGMFKETQRHEHVYRNMTDDELAAEAERLGVERKEIDSRAAVHGVDLTSKPTTH